MLKTPIKASQISNLTDARYFAARGVEWLGFNMDLGTENYLSPTEVKAIKEWVEGPKMVGEFGFQPVESIASTASALELDGVQVDEFTDANDLRTQLSIPIIQHKIFQKDQSNDQLIAHLQQQQENVNYFLLDFAANGISWENLETTSQLTRSELAQICKDYPILLSLDVAPENLEELITQLSPQGLNLRGGDEEKVGFKSYEELDDILDLLEVEDFD